MSNVVEVETKEQLDALATSKLNAQEIFEAVNRDLESISYIAKTKAMLLDYRHAIELIEIGASAGSVIQALQLTAPQLISNAYRAEFKYFRKRYLSDPRAWEQHRKTQKELLESFTNHDESAPLYSEKIIEDTLIYEGYGLNVPENKPHYLA